jgi:glycosyltransferase involved in cell wall biosynthesis
MPAHRYTTDHREAWPGGQRPSRVAYLSTYPPRECGIATFCEDLVTATLLGDNAAEPIVVAMESGDHGRAYPWPVALRVDDDWEEQYAAAADFINDSSVDLVSIQHEFGIFGGIEGSGLFRFLERLRTPVVTTLHTVLPEPDERLRENVQALARHSQRLVVMNGLAIDILHRDYGIDKRKIELIHHGTLPPSLESKEQAKERLGLSGRKVISTFGLVARGKGLEYAIRALPHILPRHPDACYVVVGRTHPGVQRMEKESYREELLQFVDDHGLHDSVRFVNRYVSKSEIVRYLAATDIYITPYLNPQQITSGTLAYALAAGTAIVSTPYLYARFLLDEDRGVLVDFRSESEIGQAVSYLLDHPQIQRSLERRGSLYGQQMSWPAVGAHYLNLFETVVREAARPARSFHAQLQLTLTNPVERNARHAIERSRPAPTAGASAASDGLLRHRTAR